MRERIVLATKTQQRSGEGLREHLERSLRMLRTDRIDLYQLHQIAQETDWEAVTAPGGALEEALRAREAGKIRYLGVTSHSLPMALKMIRTGLFSTVQFPFNFIEEAAADELLPVARQLGMGFIVMKPFGGGAIDNAEAAFKYLRQHHGIVPIPGFESTAQIDEVFSFYRGPNTVTEEDRSVMERYRQELGKRFCRRCEYCQPCPQGVMITSAMGYRILVNRMSPQVATEFLQRFHGKRSAVYRMRALYPALPLRPARPGDHQEPLRTLPPTPGGKGFFRAGNGLRKGRPARGVFSPCGFGRGQTTITTGASARAFSAGLLLYPRGAKYSSTYDNLPIHAFTAGS